MIQKQKPKALYHGAIHLSGVPVSDPGQQEFLSGPDQKH